MFLYTETWQHFFLSSKHALCSKLKGDSQKYFNRCLNKYYVLFFPFIMEGSLFSFFNFLWFSPEKHFLVKPRRMTWSCVISCRAVSQRKPTPITGFILWPLLSARKIKACSEKCNFTESGSPFEDQTLQFLLCYTHWWRLEGQNEKGKGNITELQQ